MSTDSGALAKFKPFTNQSHLVHALLVAVGAVIWAGIYVGFVSLVGWTDVVMQTTGAGYGARRIGAAVATSVTGVYFSVLTIFARGGFVLNMLYPGLLWIAMPNRVYTLFQKPYIEFPISPAGVDLSLRSLSGIYIVHFASVFVPSFIFTISILKYLIENVATEAQRDRIHRRLPEEVETIREAKEE